jgi:hypothetical protein
LGKILIKIKRKRLNSSIKELLHSYPQYCITFKQKLIKFNPLFFGTEEVVLKYFYFYNLQV